MINNFDEARKLLKELAKLDCQLHEDEAVFDKNTFALKSDSITQMSSRLGETIALYQNAIQIYNALTAAVNATNPSFELMNKPKHLKIIDEQSLTYDLKDVTKNIPLLAAIKAAKAAGDVEIDSIIDYLLSQL